MSTKRMIVRKRDDSSFMNTLKWNSLFVCEQLSAHSNCRHIFNNTYTTAISFRKCLHLSGYSTISIDCKARDTEPYLEPVLPGLSPGTVV